MSLHVGKWVRGWKLGEAVKKLTKVPDVELLKEASAKGVILLDNLRKAAVSPTADLLVRAIPGDWDTKLKDALINVIIPNIMKKLSDAPTVIDKITTTFAATAEIPDETDRSLFWHSLSSSLAYEIGLLLTGQKPDINDIFVTVALVFKEIFGHKKTA